MALGQNFNTYWDCSKRLLHSALLFMFLFLEFVFLSSYSTDMAVVQPPKLIKTLEDLYSSSLKPIFLKSDNLYAQFMNSESTRYSNVWKKVQQCGLDNCLLEGNFDMVAKLDFSPSKRDVAMVYSTAYLPAMVNYMCNILGKSYKEVKEEGQRVFNSQPFSSVNLAFVINRNTESNLRQRIVEFSYFVIESGYIEKGWKESEQFVEPVYGCNCPHTIFEDEKTVTLPEPVSLSIFNRVLIAFLVAVGFGIIILLTEITVSRLRNSSNLAVIEPDSVPPDSEHVSAPPSDTVSVTSTEANSKVEGTSGGSHMDGLNDETNQNFEENND